MLPDKYLRDLESSARRQGILENLAVLVTLLLSLLVLGPLLHESLHVIPLEIIGCQYRMSFGLSMGIYASIKPLCTPGTGFLAVFYMAGYAVTLVTGYLFNYHSRRITGLKARLSASLGTGLLGSTVLATSIHGDLGNFISITGMDSSLAPLLVLVLAAVLAAALPGVRTLAGIRTGGRG